MKPAEKREGRSSHDKRREKQTLGNGRGGEKREGKMKLGIVKKLKNKPFGG